MLHQLNCAYLSAGLKSICDSPLKNPSYALTPGDIFADHLIPKKKKTKKKEKKEKE